MSSPMSQLLEECRPEGIAALERLLQAMAEAGCQRVMLTDHPDYGLQLGIAESDADLPVQHVELIPEFDDRYDELVDPDGDDEDEGFYDTDARWAWIRECWIAAMGPESGRTVVLFANGLGDMMDLTTGRDPDDETGLDPFAG